MYLTKFAVNPARREGRKLLGSPQAMHAAVMSGFDPGVAASGDTDGRVLWRVDSDAHARHLFIASPTPPDLTHLVEQAGWPTTSTWQTRDYRALLARLDEGQRWAFRLTANPVHSVRTRDDQERTKPTAHVTVAHQQGWLVGRSTTNGFHVPVDADGIPAATVVHREVVRFARSAGTVTLSRSTFEGILEVTDPDALRHALTRGIGRAKGYGCGLMTLAPPP